MDDVTKDMQKSLPTDFDLASSVSVSRNITNDIDSVPTSSSVSSFDTSLMVDAFKEALEGMAFKVDGDKMGELIVADVEKVIYS